MRTHPVHGYNGIPTSLLIGLWVVVLLAVSCGGNRPAPTPESTAGTRVLIVHSYSNAFPWTARLNDGIIEGLRRMDYTDGQDYQLRTFFMDTRVKYTSSEQVQERALEALRMMESYAPDILFVTDDNALKEVAVSYALQHPGTPVATVFSGVNVDPSVYSPIESLGRPGSPITGALERIPYTDAFRLGKRLFPDASKIVILGDASGSSAFVVHTFEQDYPGPTDDAPLEVLDFVLLETFDDWKAAILDYQDKADIIGVLNYQQLTDGRGNVVAAEDVVAWMLENNRLPELGLVSEWAEDGILVSAGNSGYKTGIYAGVVGGRILRGQDPGTIPIVDPGEMDVEYNLQRARMLNIEFPSTELVAAAEVFNSIGRTE